MAGDCCLQFADWPVEGPQDLWRDAAALRTRTEELLRNTEHRLDRLGTVAVVSQLTGGPRRIAVGLVAPFQTSVGDPRNAVLIAVSEGAAGETAQQQCERELQRCREYLSIRVRPHLASQHHEALDNVLAELRDMTHSSPQLRHADLPAQSEVKSLPGTPTRARLGTVSALGALLALMSVIFYQQRTIGSLSARVSAMEALPTASAVKPAIPVDQAKVDNMPARILTGIEQLSDGVKKLSDAVTGLQLDIRKLQDAVNKIGKAPAPKRTGGAGAVTGRGGMRSSRDR